MLPKNNLEGKVITLHVDGEETKETSSEKILGVVVNNVATWKNRFYGDDENLGILKELSKRLGILKKLRSLIP